MLINMTINTGGRIEFGPENGTQIAGSTSMAWRIAAAAAAETRNFLNCESNYPFDGPKDATHTNTHICIVLGRVGRCTNITN